MLNWSYLIKKMSVQTSGYILGNRYFTNMKFCVKYTCSSAKFTYSNFIKQVFFK